MFLGFVLRFIGIQKRKYKCEGVSIKCVSKWVGHSNGDQIRREIKKRENKNQMMRKYKMWASVQSKENSSATWSAAQESSFV